VLRDYTAICYGATELAGARSNASRNDHDKCVMGHATGSLEGQGLACAGPAIELFQNLGICMLFHVSGGILLLD
jgi:hypothetical protein